MNQKRGTPKSLNECIDNIVLDLSASAGLSCLDPITDLNTIISAHIKEYFNNRFASIVLLLTHKLSNEDEKTLIDELNRIYDGPELREKRSESSAG